jgi:excisionase family DNA binding protein
MPETTDLRLREVEEIVGVDLRTLQALARRGDLPGAYKIGNHWRVRREALEEIRKPKQSQQ